MNRSHSPADAQGKSMSKGWVVGLVISAILWAAAIGFVRVLI